MFLFDRCNLGKFLHQPRESSTADVHLMWHRKLCIHYFGCSFFPSLVYTILPKIHSMKYENTKIISYLIKYFTNKLKLVIDENMLKYSGSILLLEMYKAKIEDINYSFEE